MRQQLNGEARRRLILWMRRRIDEFGITVEDLVASLEQDQSRLATPKYRDANGNEWDGVGDIPEWLKRALNAGQSLSHFSIATAEETDRN